MESPAPPEARLWTPGPWAHCAMLAIPVLAVALMGVWVADPQVSWRSQSLVWLLAYGPTALAVGFIVIPAGRHFLDSGQLSVLMLGCGMWVVSLGVLGGAGVAKRSLDLNWAIYDSAFLLAACCHFTGVVLPPRLRIRPQRSATWLALIYGGGLAAVGLLFLAALEGWLPAFQGPGGQGGTPLRGGVLGATVALFLVTALLLWKTHRRTPSPFLYWYALGLALIAMGLAASSLIEAGDSLLQWGTRTSRALGTVYLCVAVLEARAPSFPMEAVAETWREPAFMARLRRHSLLGWVLDYALAAVLVMAALWVHLALTRAFGPGLPPYILVYPAVVAAAVLGGLGPGVAATLLACLGVGRLGPAAVLEPMDRLGLVIFAAMGLGLSLGADYFRRFREKAAAYDQAEALKEAARAAHERFQLALSCMTFAALLVTEDDRVDFANQVFCDLFRIPEAPDSLRSRTSGQVLARIGACYLDPGRELARVAEILGRRELVQDEEIAMRDGRTLLRDFIPIRQGDRDFGRLWVHKDITGRRQAEESMRELSLRLREEAARKDDFIAQLGHELRNPLVPIGNAVYLLRRAGQDPELLENACAIAEHQVAHISRLVDDLLDVSRIARGKVELKKEVTDLVRDMEGVVRDYQPVFQENQLTLEVSLPPEPVTIEADRARVAQVVSNLLHNAIKFTDPGGRVGLAVSVPERGWSQVTVQDNGAGIPAQLLSTIFEPFMQSGTTLDRARGGLGMGLALAKGLVELHGGTITAQSDGPGLGSRFTVRLPGTPERQGPEAQAARGQAGRGRRILVVEDLQDAALTLRLLLEMAGHQVEVAFDGRSGLDQAGRFRPEVILCDIGLPGELDGYGVARTLRTTPGQEGTWLVAMTGFGSAEAKDKAVQSGFDLTLIKPVAPETLERVIDELPDRRSA